MTIYFKEPVRKYNPNFLSTTLKLNKVKHSVKRQRLSVQQNSLFPQIQQGTVRNNLFSKKDRKSSLIKTKTRYPNRLQMKQEKNHNSKLKIKQQQIKHKCQNTSSLLIGDKIKKLQKLIQLQKCQVLKLNFQKDLQKNNKMEYFCDKLFIQRRKGKRKQIFRRYKPRYQKTQLQKSKKSRNSDRIKTQGPQFCPWSNDFNNFDDQFCLSNL